MGTDRQEGSRCREVMGWWRSRAGEEAAGGACGGRATSSLCLRTLTFAPQLIKAEPERTHIKNDDGDDNDDGGGGGYGDDHDDACGCCWLCRIGTAEVESALSSHPLCAEAAIVRCVLCVLRPCSQAHNPRSSARGAGQGS